MITLHGVVASRAARCVWMLEELGVPYQINAVLPARTPEFLAINPNARIPALTDGALVMWESLAINCYLARRYPNELSPKTIDEEALCLKWSFWAYAELECFFNHVESLDAVTDEWRERTLGVLEGQLQRTPFLIGERFTVADLNVSLMFWGPVSSRVDLAAFPATHAWRAATWERPAALRTFDLIQTANSQNTEG